MITIIEGPDGAGKTTLARELLDLRPGCYHHEGPPPAGANLLHHYTSILLDLDPKKNHVLDRLAMGELVYGPILRGGSRLSFDEFVLFERVRRGLGARHVLCLPNYRRCKVNWAARKGIELIEDETQIRAAYLRFRALANVLGPSVTTYDYEFQGVDGGFMRSGLDLEGTPCLPRVIGSPEAWLLLVAYAPDNAHGLPFFAWDDSAEGRVNKALRLAGIGEREVAFTSADGKVYPRPGQLVVAIDEEAYEALDEMAVPINTDDRQPTSMIARNLVTLRERYLSNEAA